MKLLHLDSSITGDQSVSRILSAEIVAAQIALHPGIEVTYHDLAIEAPLHLSPAHMAAFQGAPVESEALANNLALGTQFMEELFMADVLVIGAPMYNHTVPTQLKAWIDRIAVAGRTFRYTEKGPVGLLPPGKKVFIAASTGGIYSGDSPAKAFEHSETYLRGVLALIGLTDVTTIRAEGIGMGPEARVRAIESARRTIAELNPLQRAA
ncbi:FMN-dependent NADH-azoreductase [Terricaulis silvestris]|uniref:FMN dependent NADH:quinone oxidoreductase n=1 Tax=Terricaulis silvestris TaxID=2686094 RepID=A0A6I6ML86_9CAUL|nr:NAD(P)H-dependent oxidoreductase [Terricaulis silvestris]QGZ93724.1 FMN-dependent NADH-azoreductase [Terricaulis silvestris]